MHTFQILQWIFIEDDILAEIVKVNVSAVYVIH